VAAEDAPVVVKLVDDDVLEVLEEVDPLGVVGQDSGVEHIRVGEDDLADRPDCLAGVLGRVSVVGVIRPLAHPDHLVELRPLSWARALVGKR
jgi:hypothetical protein